MKRLILSFSFGFIFLLLTSSCGAGWFSKEKEVKDEYLEKLFTPNFHYESVKLVEDSKGRRFIVVKTKEKVDKLLGKYANLLLSRGVNIHGDYHYGYFSWQKTVAEFAITITRKVEGEQDTIEVSESRVTNPETGKPVVAVSGKGKEIRIAIEKDFGKKWKKIKIMPDKEPDVPEPKIGRYPGAKLIKIVKWPSSDKSWIYVAKASIKEVAYYFKDHLEKKLGEKASGSTYWEKEVKNSSRYRYPIEIFGIKTVGLYIRF